MNHSLKFKKKNKISNFKLKKKIIISKLNKRAFIVNHSKPSSSIMFSFFFFQYIYQPILNFSF